MEKFESIKNPQIVVGNEYIIISTGVTQSYDKFQKNYVGEENGVSFFKGTYRAMNIRDNIDQDGRKYQYVTFYPVGKTKECYGPHGFKCTRIYHTENAPEFSDKAIEL